MHMSMHEVNKPGSVPPNPRLIQAVGVWYTWHDDIGGDEGDWGSKAIESTIFRFLSTADSV